MKFVKLITILALIQSTAQAAIVKQLLNDQNLVLVELKKNENVAVGDKFIVGDDKNQCLLEVVSIDKKIANLSSKNCTDKSLLSIGKKIEKSLFDPNLVKQESAVAPNASEPTVADTKTQENTPSLTESETYTAFIIGYMLSPKITISGTALTGTVLEAGTFEYNFSNALKFGFEWSQFSKNTWNNGFLIDYASLKFDSVTVKSGGSSSSGSLSGGMTILTVAYTGKYRWEQFYFPVALGLSSSTVDSTGSFTKTLQTRAYASLGVGFAITKSFNLEFTSNSHSVTGSTITSGGTTIYPDVGYLNNLQLDAKILF